MSRKAPIFVSIVLNPGSDLIFGTALLGSDKKVAPILLKQYREFCIQLQEYFDLLGIGNMLQLNAMYRKKVQEINGGLCL